MDAFKKLMDQTSDLDNFVDEERISGDSGDEDKAADCYQWLLDLRTLTSDTSSRSPIAVSPTYPSLTRDLDARLGGVEEVEDWRPMSPDHSGIGLGLYDSMDHYDL